ncbi:hypothetical protein BKA70DRAFT_1521665 [Coprinopsis sp. MPI-PUGE-AT-0042]|nr:hypothetical protein BKA70DRAFT_1521665 [Coprinopsis sp. MPI-PUGE-AT-0042]
MTPLRLLLQLRLSSSETRTSVVPAALSVHLDSRASPLSIDDKDERSRPSGGLPFRLVKDGKDSIQDVLSGDAREQGEKPGPQSEETIRPHLPGYPTHSNLKASLAPPTRRRRRRSHHGGDEHGFGVEDWGVHLGELDVPGRKV